jgi:hypothetical protein
MLVLPVIGLLLIYLTWSRSTMAFIIAIGVEIVSVLVFIEYRTYCIRVTGGEISRGSWLHSATLPLKDVDLIQVVHETMSAPQYIYLRSRGRVRLQIFRELDGFDDIIGFLREYARHNHVVFQIRDQIGKWS